MEVFCQLLNIQKVYLSFPSASGTIVSIIVSLSEFVISFFIIYHAFNFLQLLIKKNIYQVGNQNLWQWY